MSIAYGKMLAGLAILATAVLTVPAGAESKARIVRLSEVQGTVQIDRAAGDGFERAFLNLPVIEGSKLKTGKDGRAEVEFEDGSALRLAPDSEVDFTRLALGNNGQKLSDVQLMSGTVYANLHPKKGDKKAEEKSGDQFQLKFSQESVTVSQSAHFRVGLSDAEATVAVFKGKVSATSPAGQVEVAEKHSATIALSKDDAAKVDVATDDVAKSDPAGDSPKGSTFTIAKNYEERPTDAWDQQQTDYHDRYATSSGALSINSPYGYGMSDLNYYGNFMSLPGYGNVWQPYLIGSNWDPFLDGAWAFYPGAGYMWVSGYPWGWMPYNYGNWAFVPGYGWVWQPGYFNYYGGIPQVVNPPVRTKVPTPPTRGHQTVLVGRGLTANPVGAPRHLTIDPGSAGIGVPRGSVRHLDHVARTMTQTSRPVTVATVPPPSTSSSNAGFGTRSPSMRGGSPMGTVPMAPPHRSAAPSRPH